MAVTCSLVLPGMCPARGFRTTGHRTRGDRSTLFGIATAWRLVLFVGLDLMCSWGTERTSSAPARHCRRFASLRTLGRVGIVLEEVRFSGHLKLREAAYPSRECRGGGGTRKTGKPERGLPLFSGSSSAATRAGG